MPEKILLDTNVLIDILRHRDKNINTAGVDIVGFTPYISTISIAELYSGKSIEAESEEELVTKFITAFNKIHPNEEILKKAGEIFRKRECRGGLIDAIIAASAIVNNITLLTYNPKHFKDIKELKYLTSKELRED